MAVENPGTNPKKCSPVDQEQDQEDHVEHIQELGGKVEHVQGRDKSKRSRSYGFEDTRKQ